MTMPITKETIKDGYKSVMAGISSNLSSETLNQIKSIDVCLFGSGAIAVLGLDIEPGDLDFHIKFNFEDELLTKIVEKQLAPDSHMGILSKSDKEYFSKQSDEIKHSVFEIIKLFLKQQESINDAIMSAKPLDIPVDVTADKMMFNSTSFSMNIGRVGDIEYPEDLGQDSKFNPCLMSLEKNFIRKLTSNRDKDSAYLPSLAKSIDIEVLIATIKQMQSYNSLNIIEELGWNLLSTSHESTNSEKECHQLYNRYKEVIRDITQNHYHDSDSDSDCFDGLSDYKEETSSLNQMHGERYHDQDLDLNY
jgi:hypothetical protein